jgi:hypothetical protein
MKNPVDFRGNNGLKEKPDIIDIIEEKAPVVWPR